MLHPMGADPGDASAAFTEYAADTHWVATHLTQFLGVALMFVGLVAPSDAVQHEPAGWIARLGVVFGASAICAAWQSPGAKDFRLGLVGSMPSEGWGQLPAVCCRRMRAFQQLP